MSLPRIEKVQAQPKAKLRLKVRGESGWRAADLSGFIARYAGLAPLEADAVFRRAKVIDWGAAVGWPGDLDIGARTLVRLSDEQSTFSNAEFRAWQNEMKLSNTEAADVLGVSLATIKNYRSAAGIPTAIAIACRAMRSDPAILAAHFEPRAKTRRAV
ncbi:MAG: DUF2442 domain-containing protein [Alphaproteobacteria bacterium]|nr:DUF2442 domain-containing protein [Alphaproteobacteria bacterium]